MRFAEFREGLVILQDSIIDQRRLLEKVGKPDHVHGFLSDLPHPLPPDITAGALMRFVEEWAKKIGLLGKVSAVTPACVSPGTAHYSIYELVGDCPFESVLLNSQVDYLAKGYKAINTNKTGVDGTSFQVDIPGGRRHLPIRERLSYKLWTSFHDNMQMTEQAEWLLHTMLDSRVLGGVHIPL